MGRQSIWEYFRSVYARYRQAAREVKRKILDEFCAVLRKYSVRRGVQHFPQLRDCPLTVLRVDHQSSNVTFAEQQTTMNSRYVDQGTTDGARWPLTRCFTKSFGTVH